MNKHKGNSIKKVKKNCFPKTKQKNHGKVKSTHPTRLHFLGTKMSGNKNTNKKNDKNQIKNAHPNPNREEEKRAIENIHFFTKSCQHFFSNYTKLSLIKWETKNIWSHFFLWDTVLLLTENEHAKII